MLNNSIKVIRMISWYELWLSMSYLTLHYMEADSTPPPPQFLDFRAFNMDLRGTIHILLLQWKFHQQNTSHKKFYWKHVHFTVIHHLLISRVKNFHNEANLKTL